MTVSENDRTANIALAFRRVMMSLSDRAISHAFFDPTSELFTEILQTTWKELCQEGWLRQYDFYGGPRYRLTGAGWIEGLRRANEVNEALETRLGKLSATFKKHVEDRTADVLIEFVNVVLDSGLPEGWVFNAIESNLSRTLYGRRSVEWVEPGLLIKIPSNFNHKLIDHTADIRAQLRETQEKLESASQELGEHKCPVCGSPVVGIDNNIQLSESDYGSAVAYACGRIDSDANGSAPCPSDPRFPRLEDYEFHLKENANEPVLKWTCYAEGKTPMAQQVRLNRGLGRTAEEARDRVIDSYKRMNTPWG